jgi:hypothetical protein
MNVEKRFNVGDKVRLTGKHLKSTGQTRGRAGLDKWIVQACECVQCAGGQWIRTNQKSSYFTPEAYADVIGTPDYEAVQWRHIAVGNLEKCK